MWRLPPLLLMAAACTPAQYAVVTPADPIHLPGISDSSSPAYWAGGRLYVYQSVAMPIRSEGANMKSLARARVVLFDQYERPYRWFEAIYKDADGAIYAWYHHEPGGVCQTAPLTAPMIGVAVSRDGGMSFDDLGIILTNGYAPDCEAKNGYFAGGNGDFTVIADERKGYFYFLFSNYAGGLAEQGIAVARMPFEARGNPTGEVTKYFEGNWSEPGLGGRASAVFPARVSWSAPDTDAFWGPSVHFNTYLREYAVLMSRACCEPGWPAEGTYVSFTPDLSNPAAWTPPSKVLGPTGWYPQVIGVEDGETDKRAGKTPRLFLGSESNWVIEFFSGQAPATESTKSSENRPTRPRLVRSRGRAGGSGR